MKLKFKHILFLLLGGGMLTISSCEDIKFGNAFLEKPQSSDVDLDTIFSRKAFADQVLNQAYRSLPDYLPRNGVLSWCVLEAMTDLGASAKNDGGVGGYTKGTVSASMSNPTCFPYRLDPIGTGDESSTSGPLYGIRQSWVYIENVDRVPDMTPSEKEIRKAEAKMIIAYHYSQILRHFGGMPWIDHAYLPGEEMKFERLTVEDMVNRTVGLLDEVARILPWSVDPSDDGRMTAAAALAIKTRVLLFAASPLFNSNTPFLEGEAANQRLTWYGNYERQRWQKALDAGLEFMRENKKNGEFYHLVTDKGSGRDNFVSGYFDRYNHETLISSHRYAKYTMGDGPFQQIKYGNAAPTGNYADMFDMADGTPFSWDNPVHAAHPFFDASGKAVRDARMYETLMVNGDRWLGDHTLQIFKNGIEGCAGTATNMNNFQLNAYNGYGMRKFQRNLSTEIAAKPYSCPLIRLSEVYYSIAEAMNELGLADTKDEFQLDAYDYIDLVRNRADMPDLDRTKYPSGKPLLDKILHERAVEFGYEEVRYFDLNRWMRTDLLHAPLYRLIIERDKDGVLSFTKVTDMPNPRVWIDNWSDRYFLLPIVETELNKEYGLIQNPGWS